MPHPLTPAIDPFESKMHNLSAPRLGDFYKRNGTEFDNGLVQVIALHTPMGPNAQTTVFFHLCMGSSDAISSATVEDFKNNFTPDGSRNYPKQVNTLDADHQLTSGFKQQLLGILSRSKTNPGK